MGQPEGRLARKIIKSWQQQGVFAYKVHGSEYQPAGIPDISGIYQGWSVWCEVKLPGNKPSDIQEHRISQIRSAGGLVVVAYSMNEAQALIDHLDEGHTPHCRCEYGKGKQ